MSAERSRLASLRDGLLLSFLLFALPASATPAPMPEGQDGSSSALTLEVSKWTVVSRPLSITVTQGGVLEGRRLAIFLFVDGNQFERITTRSDRTRASIVLPEMAPGPHVLVARSGTEVAEAEFRLIPRSWAAGALLLIVLILLIVLEIGRRARARRRS